MTATDWLVIERAFDPAQLGHSGSIFSLSNGVLGVRGGPAEWTDGHATLLASAFVQAPLSYHESFPGFASSTDTRLLGPGITGLRLVIDGVPVDFARAELVETRCDLDMRTASAIRQSWWRLSDGREIALACRRFVPMDAGALCVERHEISATNFSGEIVVVFPIEMAPLSDEDKADPRISARARFHFAEKETTGSGYVVRFVAGTDDADRLSAVQRLTTSDTNAELVSHRSIQFRAAQGVPFVVDRHVELTLGDHQRAANADGFDTLFDRQKKTLAAFWDGAAVDLPDAPDLAAAIRFNLLQTFLSASRDHQSGTAAKGLSGEGYEGHCFWDNEAFVLPVLALTQPALARNGIVWRIAGLAKARANARAIGHARGALYPWRTIAGEECSAHYPTGSAQYHVNAAIAYALEVYLLATGDSTILAQGGAEMLVETARLWFDLGHFSERRGGAFLIHGVTGPDEYTALVDNDFYTNAMARRHLLFAARAVEQLVTSDPAAHRQLALELELNSAELDDWRRAAGRMWLAVDAELDVHPQDDTFLDKPLFPGLPIEEGDNRPLLMRVHPMILYRHRLTKQGDVVQAHVTAGLDASLAQIGRDFAYYEPLTTHDSTLSMTAFAIAAAWLGEDAKALDYWRQTALVDLGNLHGNSDHGLHMAAMAGSWLVLAQGWAGLRLDDEHLRLAPRCPKGWETYGLRLRWHDSLIEVAVSPAATTYRLLDGPPLTLFDRGRAVALDTAPQTVARPAIEAVIFDLDGVLTDTAEAHYHAWKRLADEHGIPFDREINEGLKGVDRPNSLRRILEAAGVEVDAPAFEEMLAQKNGYYVDSIASFSPADLFPGSLSLLLGCRKAGLKTGLASASRNAADLIERMGITHLFDHITDSATITRGKPDPEIFLATASALGVAPEWCLGVEDASAGIAAIRGAGMTSFGVGSETLLSDADWVFPDIAAITLSDILGVAGLK